MIEASSVMNKCYVDVENLTLTHNKHMRLMVYEYRWGHCKLKYRSRTVGGKSLIGGCNCLLFSRLTHRYENMEVASGILAFYQLYL